MTVPGKPTDQLMIPETMVFHRQRLADIEDPQAFELGWMNHCALTGQAIACLWQGSHGWSVPKRYSNLPNWERSLSERKALRIRLRESGGGLVPQGKGIWNLSLIFEATDKLHVLANGMYSQFCDLIRSALTPLQLSLQTQAVAGSFCDGRYNLAVNGRKLIGTAQAWRRVKATPIVLIHAVLFVDIPCDQLVDEANHIEALIGGSTRYQYAAVSSIKQAVAPELQSDIENLTIHAIESFFISNQVKGEGHGPHRIFNCA